MKKLLLIIPASVLLLAGCGQSASSNESLYLQAIRSDGGVYGQKGTDAELLKLGNAACREFENGSSVTDLANSVELNNDDERKFLATQIAASAAFLCPDKYKF